MSHIDLNLRDQINRYNVSYTLIFGGKVLKTRTGVYANSVQEAKDKCVSLLEATTKFEITKVNKLPKDLDFSTKRRDQEKLIEQRGETAVQKRDGVLRRFFARLFYDE